MSRHLPVLALLLGAAFASSVLASAQAPFSPTDSVSQNPAGISPAAFVYVSSSPSSNTYQINAYGVAPNGKLIAVTGSPFSANVPGLASSSKYLFGTNGVEIDSYSIANDGAIAQVSNINAQQLNQGDCGGPFDIFLDRTGSTLYDMDYIGNICANNPYQSFSVDGASGALAYIGVTSAASPMFATTLSFLANNKYAYGSSCLFMTGPQIYGFERSSNNSLTHLSITPPLPAPPTGNYYCPGQAAADNADHVAVLVEPMNASNQQPTGGPTQIAIYTADSSGNLTTTSTNKNMPATAVTGVYDYTASPSGKFVAVGGTNGVQIFHFNGANPLTRFSALLPTEAITQLAWDNNDHLYAISTTGGELYVFTVTATKVTPTPGSPYSIANPQSITVTAKN
jgi:hypothetical protein